MIFKFTLPETSIANTSPWKLVVGRPLSFWDGPISGAMWVLGRVHQSEIMPYWETSPENWWNLKIIYIIERGNRLPKLPFLGFKMYLFGVFWGYEMMPSQKEPKNPCAECLLHWTTAIGIEYPTWKLMHYHLTCSCSSNDLYFWRSITQNKAFSNQNKWPHLDHFSVPGLYNSSRTRLSGTVG